MSSTKTAKAIVASLGGLLAIVLLAGPALADGQAAKGAGPAFAPEGPGPGPEMGPPHGGGHHPILKMIKKFGKEIGVTDEQKENIKDLLGDFRDEVKPLYEQAGDLHEELEAILSAKKIDKKAALSKHAEIEAVQQKIAKRRFELVLDVLDVLTADQRAQLFEILDECKPMKGKDKGKEKGKGKGKGGCPGFGPGPDMDPGMGPDVGPGPEGW